MKKSITLGSYKDLSKINFNEFLLLDTKRAKQENIVNLKNLPSFRQGNSGDAILLIHDIGSSPADFSLMIDYILKLGYTIYNCRLPGHGTNIEYLKKFTFVDWYDSLKYGYYTLKNTSKRIIILGKGVGAYLAFLLSMYNRVDRLIFLLPQIDSKTIKFNSIIKMLLYPIKKNTVNYDYNEDNQEFTYNYLPCKVISESKSLIKFIIKNIDLYNRNIPITLHTFESKNIYLLNKTTQFLKMIKNNNIHIEMFNIDLLKKFHGENNA
jgi:carboxylesterase